MKCFAVLSLLLVSCQDTQESTSTEKKNVESPKKTEKPAVEKKVVPTTESPKEVYKKQAESLMAKIDGSGSAEEIATLSKELTKTGLSMLPALVELHKECTEYLGAIQSIGPTLHTLPLEEIESGYHADGKLPQVSSAECYHGKDLVVHPATVTALAKAGLTDRAKAKHEIEEVLEHLGAIPLK